MMQSEKRPEETSDKPDQANGSSDTPTKGEWVALSPMGTEGCLWDEDFSWLDESEGDEK